MLVMYMNACKTNFNLILFWCAYWSFSRHTWTVVFWHCTFKAVHETVSIITPYVKSMTRADKNRLPLPTEIRMYCYLIFWKFLSANWTNHLEFEMLQTAETKMITGPKLNCSNFGL